jgi:hypothetical protein
MNQGTNPILKTYHKAAAVLLVYALDGDALRDELNQMTVAVERGDEWQLPAGGTIALLGARDVSSLYAVLSGVLLMSACGPPSAGDSAEGQP